MVPYLVGFTPERSVVLIGMHGPRGAVLVTARVDLDAPTEAADAWFGAARNSGADAFVLALYDDRVEVTPLPHQEIVDAVTEMGKAHDMRLTDALAVSETRWWSYGCRNNTCCPSTGTQLIVDGEVAAEAVVNGLVTRPSRSNLVAELDPDPDRVAATHGIFEALSDRELLARALRPGAGSVRLRRSTELKRADSIQRECVKSSRSATPKEIVDLALPMLDLIVRDCMMGAIPPSGGDDVLKFWRDICRGCPESLVAGPATVYALCAYAAGDGARANVGIDRALSARPDYNMALLLLQAVSGGMRPKDLVPSLVRECERIRGKVARRGRRTSRG